MANTLGQMQTEIWDWTDTDSTRVPAAYITRITNGIIADLSRSADLLFNEYNEDFTATIGVNQYNLSGVLDNKFSRPFSMWYTDTTGAKVRVGYMSPEAFDLKYANADDDDYPTNYTIFANQIIIGPYDEDGSSVPVSSEDTTYTITFKYYGYPADLASTSDTNKYLTNAWDVIQYGVLGEVCKFLIEDQRVGMFVPEYKERRRRFLIEHARAKTSGARSESREPGWLE